MLGLTIEEVSALALQKIDLVLEHWLPGGRYRGAEYLPLNPTRDDKKPGSFSVNRTTGKWAEFADDKKGTDLVSLVAYLEGVSQRRACDRLAQFIGITALDKKPKSQAPASQGWQAVMPVSVEAEKSCPVQHPKYGAPSSTWEYRDLSNALLMKVLRFDGKAGSSKEYRPLAYCKNRNGGHSWRWQYPERGRPMYGLNRLAVSPVGAAVLISEGEKAADAAANLLPSFVSMSWPGGSKAIAKVDFTVLNDRKVVLWPDNDTAGLSCMEKLAEMLVKTCSEVSMLQLEAFGSSWPEKADAADVEEYGYTKDQVCALVSSTKWLKKYGGQTNFEAKKGPFVVNESGVFFQSGDGSDRVCDRLDIVARTRDKHSMNWGTLVRFCDPDGLTKEWNIPSELLAVEGGSEIFRQLYNMGLCVEPERASRRLLMRYLQLPVNERYVLVNKLGWHGAAYLLPGNVIGNPKEPLYFYSQSPDLNKSCQSGTLSEWQYNVASHARGNPWVMFAIASAFAAPLLHLVGIETTGFHFFGDSSQGKTTLLKVAASVYGPPDYMRTWRSTDNALESVAAAHSDSLLILDEISQCDSRIVGDITYMLGNGKGKSRANERGMARSGGFEWRLIFLSTGEKTLQQHMAEVGKESKAGQEVRLLAIPSDAGSGMGIFSDLRGYVGGAELSKALSDSASRFYGAAIVNFIEGLCSENHDKIAKKIRDHIRCFCRDLPGESSGQVRRGAEKFAVVAFAGELATQLGITGWQSNESSQSARACFTAYLNARGGVGSAEDLQAVAKVKLRFEKFGESRFTRWDRDDSTVDDHGVRTMERWGFRKTLEDRNVLNDGMCSVSDSGACSEVVYYVTSEAYKNEICRDLDFRRVSRLLSECGALEKDPGAYSRSVRLPGAGRRKTRAYVIRPHMIPDMEDKEVIKKAA